MDDSKVGIGIIGTGFGADVMAPAFSAVSGASVNALCGGNANRTHARALHLGIPFATDQISELCHSEDVDLVIVATPPHLHRESVVAALDAGKHVLCEKPFGLEPSESLEMLEYAIAAERLHFLDFEFRTEPARQALSDILERGELGEARHVVITAMVAGDRFPVMNRAGWWLRREDGGGWLGAMGSHYIDALRTWFGEINSVAALFETRRRFPSLDVSEPITADDGFTARLATETGIVCMLNTASTIGAEIGPRIEVYGTERTAVLEDDRLLSLYDRTGCVRTLDYADRRSSNSHPSRGPLGAWADRIVQAVMTGRQLAPNFLDGLRCQEVIDAARRSNDRGGALTAVERHPFQESLRDLHWRN